MKTKKEKDIYGEGPARYLVNFLTSEVVVNSKNIVNYERPLKLKRMVDIYESSMSLYSKIYEMSLVYTPSQFSLALKAFNKFKEDPILGEFIQKLNEISSLYKSCAENGILDEVNNLVKMKNYFYSYDYAKFLISSYINYSDSISTPKFIEDFGIDEGVFEYCVRVVGELDPELHKLYEKKKLENQELRIIKNTANLNNIVYGVKTGHTLDGREFDVIEFLKLIPFWDLETSREVLEDFGVKKGSEFSVRIRSLVKQVIPEYYHELIQYMNDNKIETYSFRPLKDKDIYNVRVTINGVEFTEEDKDVVMNYIVENNLPPVVRSYEAVRSKYLAGEITRESVKSKKYVPKEKYTLIP